MALALVALLVGAHPSPLQAQSQSGSVIVNVAEVTFEDSNGFVYPPVRASATLEVRRMAGLIVEPDQTQYSLGKTTLVFPHTIRNVGNAADTVQLSVSPPPNWAYQLRLDANNNGVLDPSDPVIDGVPFPLPFQGTQGFFLELTVPPDLPVGSSHHATVEGWSAFEPAIRDHATDIVLGPPLGLRLIKTVDKEEAVPGDTLLYTVAIEFYGEGKATAIVIRDPVPEHFLFLPGSVTLDGVAVGLGSGARGAWDDETRTLAISHPDREAGDRSVLEFRGVVPADTDPGTVLRNVARATWATAAGTSHDTSEPVFTTILVPDLDIEKTAQAPEPAVAGDTIDYTIVVRNLSSIHWARGIQVTDTIPLPLNVADASGAEVDGRVVTWRDFDLAPGDSISLTLLAEVSERAKDGEEVTNRAWAGYPGGPSWWDEAEAQTLLSGKEPHLGISIEPGVLETTIGDIVPFMVSSVNDGEVGLLNVRLEVRLPVGTRLSEKPIIAYTNRKDVVQGAERAAVFGNGWTPIAPDSTLTTDSTIVMYFPGRIEVGEGFGFQYEALILNPPSPTLLTVAEGQANRGSAYAIGELVVTGETKVWVRLREARPVETRLALGKVYLDLNQNGRQDGDEPGVGGVEIWTEEGSVSRTDGDGKYSFVNVRPGRHAFRIDRTTVPVWARVLGVDVQTVDSDGWTSPQANFRLLPRIGRPVAVHLEGEEPAPEALLCQYQSDCIDADEMVPHDSLPTVVTLDIEPRDDSGEGFVWRIPEGWTLGGVNPLRANAPSVLPTQAADSRGGVWLVWPDSSVGGQRLEIVRGDILPPQTITVPPARTQEERDGETQAALLQGPAPQIFEPKDGAVLATDRMFVGAKGEPLHTVELFDGDRSLGEHQLRPDGIHDYIGMDLQEPGPHTLRLRMINSWGQERWDSIQVHIGGPPAQFEMGPETLRLTRGQESVVRIRVLDEWGVPVVTQPDVTVEAPELLLLTPDGSPSSVGHQVRAARDGWLVLTLAGGEETGEFPLTLRAHGDIEGVFQTEVWPSANSLQVTAVGQVGMGSAPESFAAVTAHGAIGEEAALTLSIDSRQLDADREAFARDVDPLQEGQYPIVGDASQRRDPGASRYAVAGRLERGLDYIAFGDLEQTEFATDLTLSRYRRALPGFTARMGTGPLVWQAFGAVTNQSLQKIQIRGDGTSGPYHLGGSVLPGTEQILIQVRARDNAARILSERPLRRHTDYQVDPESGVVLLKRPLPRFDPGQNPVFLVATYEARGDGDSSPVWGLQMSGALGDTTEIAMPFGLQMVRDNQDGRSFELFGASAGFTLGEYLRVQGEAAHAASDTASDMAHHIYGTARTPGGHLTVDGRWMNVGDHFYNPAELSVRPGIEEIAYGAAVNVSSFRAEVRREEQDFGEFGGERNRSEARVQQSMPGNLVASVSAGEEEAHRDALSSSATFLEEKLEWSPFTRLTVWGEARQQTAESGADLYGGEYVGGGARMTLFQGVSLEARHLQVTPDTAGEYSLTSFGLRSDLATGTQAWGRYQLQGGIDEERGAAILGLSQQISLGDSWTARAHFERQEGAERAPLASRIQALPYAGDNADYWAASAGTEYVPGDKPYRITAHAERREAAMETSNRATLAGDISFGSGLAVLSRQEGMWRERETGNGSIENMETFWSLWGLAFRPTRSDAFNALLKLEWKQERIPGTSSYLGQGAAQRERALAVMEILWNPFRYSEVGLRYGRRFGEQQVVSSLTGIPMTERTDADFLASRVRLGLSPWFALQAETQFLRQVGSDNLMWSAAPGVALTLANTLEIRSGYRFGELLDPDFLRHQGEGWYVTFGAQLTEHSGSTIADFWRSRIRNTP